MENGDLGITAVPRMVIILEGVLASVEITTTVVGKLRRKESKTVAINWMETPLKRVADIKRRFPDTAVDVVTFLGEEVAHQADLFFNAIGLHVNTVQTVNFRDWCWALRFQPDIVTIYDSDPERLHLYGQRGVSVMMGSDF